MAAPGQAWQGTWAEARLVGTVTMGFQVSTVVSAGAPAG